MASVHFFKLQATASLPLDDQVADIEERLIGKAIVIKDVAVFHRGEYTLLGLIDKTTQILLVALLVSFARIGD